MIKAIILGIIQGLTEWLPVSSTGHLKIAEHFLHLLVSDGSLLFDFILHIGTLIVILFFFRKEVKSMLIALARLDFKTEYGKLVPLIIVGTIPAAVIGVAIKEYVEQIFQNLLPIAIAFIICGVVLYSAKVGKEESDEIDYSAAMIIGVAEGLAIIPGFSRSGLTIAVALLLGIKREKAFRFSFLFSIPAIVGAIGYMAIKDFNGLTSAGLGWIEISAGVIAAMLVGYLTLKLLWRILSQKKFHLFAFYCWTLGLTLIVAILCGL